MNFAALWARNSGRATPSLRCTPKAPTKETRQEATYLQREVVQTTGASSVTALTDGDIESLAAGRRHLFFFGIIRYLDVFKRSHFTTFRFFAGGTEPFKGASDPDMTLCSKGNEAS